MKYMAIIDADEKPVSCEFIGCNGNVAPYLIGSTTNIESLEQELPEECISRQKALEPYKTLDDNDTISIWLLRKNIEQTPSVTPRPTGEWIVNEQLGGLYQCSECGALSALNKEDIDAGWEHPHYCSHCGALNHIGDKRTTLDETNMTIGYLENMKEEYVKWVEYDRYPTPEWFALDYAVQVLRQTKRLPKNIESEG